MEQRGLKLVAPLSHDGKEPHTLRNKEHNKVEQHKATDASPRTMSERHEGEEDIAAEASSSSSRVRSSRACLYCSRRKVKCDGMQPCQTCDRDKLECNYGAQKKRGPPKGCQSRGGRKSKAAKQSLSEPKAFLDTSPVLEQRRRQLPPLYWQTHPQSPHDTPAYDPVRLSSRTPASLTPYADRSSVYEHHHTPGGSYTPIRADDFAAASSASLRTLAHNAFLAHPLPPLAADRSWQSHSPRDQHHHHHQQQQQQRPSPAQSPIMHLDRDQNLEDRLPPAVVQRLLDIYQVFVHPHWPIIYLPSIASLHSLKHTKPIVFEAILAVASNTFDNKTDRSAVTEDYASSSSQFDLFATDSPNAGGQLEPLWKPIELRAHFVQRVKLRILQGKFQHDIATIQACILTSVVEMGSGNFSAAFQLGGIAMRMALDMNLHRTSASTMPTTSASSPHRTSSTAPQRKNNAQTQERLRVFWACFVLDKVLSTVLDKPAQLRSSEIDADWPSTQEADEFDIWLNDVTLPFVQKAEVATLEGVKVHALSTFKAWAEVMAILEKVLEQVYSPQAKRDRRKTGGESDYKALHTLNQSLAQWRNNLPAHLKWTGTWTSASSSQSAPTSIPHQGLPPHMLTMRAWYCICLILLHRPRVPKLLNLPDDSRPVVPSQSISPIPEPAGLEICNAAAKEVCDIMHVYDTTFRIRKISSSWVYLIFQSATIHAALAARKSVLAFKARQSFSRRASSTAPIDHADRDRRSESVQSVDIELDDPTDVAKTSALYLAQCIRFLKRIEATWQSATDHVSVLKSLCIASAQTRHVSPGLTTNGDSTASIVHQQNGNVAPTAPAAFDNVPTASVYSTLDDQQRFQQHVEMLQQQQQSDFAPPSQPPLPSTMQQAINANDWTFWASMPVASEGFGDWDAFFRAFNPTATTDFAAQPNHHPTATVDLIAAFQDPN